MSLPIDQLRGVPTRVIASGGNEKVECLLGAIKLIDCNVLITNEATARELLIRRSGSDHASDLQHAAFPRISAETARSA